MGATFLSVSDPTGAALAEGRREDWRNRQEAQIIVTQTRQFGNCWVTIRGRHGSPGPSCRLGRGPRVATLPLRAKTSGAVGALGALTAALRALDALRLRKLLTCCCLFASVREWFHASDASQIGAMSTFAPGGRALDDAGCDRVVRAILDDESGQTSKPYFAFVRRGQQAEDTLVATHTVSRGDAVI